MILLKILLGIILLCIAILSIAGAAFCCVFLYSEMIDLLKGK